MLLFKRIQRAHVSACAFLPFRPRENPSISTKNQEKKSGSITPAVNLDSSTNVTRVLFGQWEESGAHRQVQSPIRGLKFFSL